MTRIRIPHGAAVLVVLMTASVTALSDYQIGWWTVDGGGQMWGTGGGYTVGGTAGQPDAGRLSGGSYVIQGGFWAILAPTGPIICLGDANCDGTVDFFDIDPFVARLGCPGAGGCIDACPWENADTDQDGDVDFFDIDPFVALLGDACP